MAKAEASQQQWAGRCLLVTIRPQPIPLLKVTVTPTVLPTQIGTASPTAAPTTVPTLIPTFAPSTVPSLVPTAVPSASISPSEIAAELAKLGVEPAELKAALKSNGVSSSQIAVAISSPTAVAAFKDASKARVAAAKSGGVDGSGPKLSKRAQDIIAKMQTDGIRLRPANIAAAMENAGLTASEIAKALAVMGIPTHQIKAALSSAGVSPSEIKHAMQNHAVKQAIDYYMKHAKSLTKHGYIPSQIPNLSPHVRSIVERLQKSAASMAPADIVAALMDNSLTPTFVPSAFSSPTPTVEPSLRHTSPTPTFLPSVSHTQYPTFWPSSAPTAITYQCKLRRGYSCVARWAGSPFVAYSKAQCQEGCEASKSPRLVAAPRWNSSVELVLGWWVG